MVFKTPVKVEHDMVVQDEILVGPVTCGRVRSSSTSNPSGGKSFTRKRFVGHWKILVVAAMEPNVR